MSVKHLNGVHCSFYHYGFEHLVINLFHYCKNCLESGDEIFFSGDPQIYQEVIDVFQETGEIELDKINYKPITELITEDLEEGILEKSASKLEKIIEKSRQNGYQGLKWINQAQFAAQKISVDKYCRIDDFFNTLFSNQLASLFCFYDYEEFLKKGTNKKLVYNSYRTHDYNFHKMKIAKKKINIS